MISMHNFFEQDNNNVRNPAYSFKGWGSEKTDFVSEPGAIKDFTSKAEDSADIQNKKLVTPGPTKVARTGQVKVTYDVPPFRSGDLIGISPTSQR